jgi:ABC-type transporter Mla subunit MlaD
MSNVHFIEGQYYVEVKREANLGDYVTKDGILRTVSKISEEWDSVEFDSYVDAENDYVVGWGHGTYRTLEPIESEASPGVIDLLANLARRVTSLESQLRDTPRNLETTAEELANARHRLAKHADRFAAVEAEVEKLNGDIADLDDRSQVLNAINKYYAEGMR